MDASSQEPASFVLKPVSWWVGVFATAVLAGVLLAVHMSGVRVPFPGFLMVAPVMLTILSRRPGAVVASTLLAMVSAMVLNLEPRALVPSLPHDGLLVLTMPPAMSVLSLMLYILYSRLSEAAERPIRAREQLFAAIMAAMHDAIIEVDYNGIREVNESFCRMTGFDRSELLGCRPPFPFWPQEGFAAIAMAMESVARGKVLDLEMVLARKNGERFSALVGVSRIPDEDGRRAGAGRVVYSFRDITDLKRVEEQARENAARLRAAFDAVPFGFWLRDAKGELILQNPVSDQLYGRPDTTAPNPGIPEALRLQWQEYNRRAWAGEVVNVESEQQTLLGRRFIQEIVAPVRIDNQIRGILGTNIDVTDRHNAEAQLRHASEVKDRFLGMLSHQLRMPLTPALATIGLLLADAKTPAQMRGDLEIIRRSIEAESLLIDDLLDLTQMRMERIELRLTRADLGRMVAESLEALRDLFESRGITVEFTPVAMPVDADPRRIQQVLRHLLRNSAQCTPRGGRVTISMGQWSDGLGRAWVRIADTGMGFDAEFQSRMFQPFQQARRAADQPGSGAGMGLGLALARALVEAHGGSLTGQSAGTGKGAVFTFTLPRRPAGKALADLGTGPTVAAAKPGGLPHILLVDDHTDTEAVLSRLLRMQGYRVVTASNIAGALQAATLEPFDLLVSDIGLPDGTGLELMRKMQLIRPTRGIALSGYGSEGDMQASREAGFIEHLTKPVSMPELEAAIGRAMGGGTK